MPGEDERAVDVDVEAVEPVAQDRHGHRAGEDRERRRPRRSAPTSNAAGDARLPIRQATKPTLTTTAARAQQAQLLARLARRRAAAHDDAPRCPRRRPGSTRNQPIAERRHRACARRVVEERVALERRGPRRPRARRRARRARRRRGRTTAHGRQRRDGSRPSGNSSSATAGTSTIGADAHSPTQPTHDSAGSGVDEVRVDRVLGGGDRQQRCRAPPRRGSSRSGAAAGGRA